MIDHCYHNTLLTSGNVAVFAIPGAHKAITEGLMTHDLYRLVWLAEILVVDKLSLFVKQLQCFAFVGGECFSLQRVSRMAGKTRRFARPMKPELPDRRL
jgi:hypothetical protein